MHEQTARGNLQELLEYLREAKPNFKETNLSGGGKKGFVEYHLSKIRSECGGTWDDTKAAQYVTSLNEEYRQ